MTDIITKKPLTVSTSSTAGPYLIVHEIQLKDICRVLDEGRVRYWVSEHAVSWNGAPERTIINLGHGGNAPEVQAILDSVP